MPRRSPRLKDNDPLPPRTTDDLCAKIKHVVNLSTAILGPMYNAKTLKDLKGIAPLVEEFWKSARAVSSRVEGLVFRNDGQFPAKMEANERMRLMLEANGLDPLKLSELAEQIRKDAIIHVVREIKDDEKK